MTEFSSLLQADRGQPAHILVPVLAERFEAWVKQQPASHRALATAAQFSGKAGEMVVLPGRRDEEWSVAFGAAKKAGPWALAAIAQKLPGGTYRIENGAPAEGALGWLLAQHRFDRYLSKPDPLPARILLTQDPATIDETVAMAEAVALVRDLVDTPASDMGPAELAAAAEAVARSAGADIRVTLGDTLEQDYPMIASVGRAATRERAPRPPGSGAAGPARKSPRFHPAGADRSSVRAGCVRPTARGDPFHRRAGRFRRP